ncbi:hypothetical protein QBC35DRAFT_65191 [Podospora australis]|uniref:Alpha-1,2-mannosyltransferase n=1 Tax=Podospora australis TaxID=1536484 RepID=A0AAN6WLA4_9PEZI|nr:hypothetical protein QBC35DRAFT_65191 [Podospora australis]
MTSITMEKAQSLRQACHSILSTTPPKILYPAAFIAIYALIFFTLRLFRASKTSITRPSTPTLEKAAPVSTSKNDRPIGIWHPSSYRPPTPPPYPDWSLTETKPLPYRPFRYGPVYHTTMGLRKCPPEEWIELDNHYPKYHASKRERIAIRGDKACRTAPEAYPAALELVEMLADYLPARYPTLFKRTEKGINNLWSGEQFVVVPNEKGRLESGEDPMQVCARLIQDDLAIMIEKEDGQYYLLAGATLLPGFWRLEDKFGMGLSEIHTSGDVPQYREKLEKGMKNFFRRVKPEEMVARNNYFFQVDDQLGWSTSIGPEDSPHVSWSTAEKNKAIEHHYFRSERQTLRRLPKTGGVVFTIRTYFHPITEIAEEDYVPGRLASAVRSWGEDVSRYKGKEKYGEVLLEFLDKKHQEQIDRGLDLSREDEVRAYPY